MHTGKRTISLTRLASTSLLVALLASGFACGGHRDLDGPAIPAQSAARDDWMVEYRVPHGLPSLLDSNT